MGKNVPILEEEEEEKGKKEEGTALLHEIIVHGPHCAYIREEARVSISTPSSYPTQLL